MVRFNHRNREFEFKGEYGIPSYPQYYLSKYGGTVVQALGDREEYVEYGPVAIVHLVPKEHILGGVKFVETGEYRPPQNEWYLGVNTILFGSGYINYTILEPVEIL